MAVKSMIGALVWFATRGNEEKMREFAAMKWQIEYARPDVEREAQWEAWLLSVQRELEQGRAEIPS